MDTSAAHVLLRVTSRQAGGRGPICHGPTRRLHSRSGRTVGDLPWAHYRVVLQLCVRKFVCANTQGRRPSFTERLPGLVAPWARRTQRRAAGLAPMAVALGGAAGARPGAPTALQVAARLHLLQHLAEALEQVVHAQGQALKAGHEALRQASGTPPAGTVAVPVPPPPRTAQARRLGLQQPIWAFHQQGWPGGALATQLGRGQKPGCRDRRTTTVPARTRRTDRGRRLLTPSTTDRLERGHAGCRDAVRRVRALHWRGYPGSDATVAREAPRLRQAQGQAPHHRPPRQLRPVVVEPPCRPLTARRATWLVLRRPETLDEPAAAPLAPLNAQPPEVAAALVFAQDCAQLLRERQPDHLDRWLARAAERPRVPRQRWRKGRRDDEAAVTAGVPLPWSTGPVEGHIHRLQRLTRQMFGRARLARLRRRC